VDPEIILKKKSGFGNFTKRRTPSGPNSSGPSTEMRTTCLRAPGKEGLSSEKVYTKSNSFSS
jgi:hypothetical protein